MASASAPAPLGDPAHPDIAPPDAGLAAVFGQADPKAIRRAHLRDESYARAVGLTNHLYAVLFVAYDAYLLAMTFLHLSGRIIAPWSVRPGWVALQVNFALMALLAAIAGRGFRRLRPWALRVEALFVLCFLIQWPLSIIAYSRPMGVGYFAGGVALLAAFLVPLINLWDVRDSLVFSPEYRRVIAAMPGLRVRAKLPWELKLLMLVLFVTATTILVFAIDR